MPRGRKAADPTADSLSLIVDFSESYGTSNVTIRLVSTDASFTMGRAMGAYAGLQIVNHGYVDSRDSGFMYHRLGIEPRTGLMDAADAERIYKALHSLGSALDKIAANYGESASFGAYVQRVASVVGAKYIGTYPPRGANEWMDGSRVRWQPTKDIAYVVDSFVQDWKEQTGRFKPEYSLVAVS